MKTVPREARFWLFFAVIKILAFVAVLLSLVFSYSGNAIAFGGSQFVVTASLAIAIFGMYPRFSKEECDKFRSFNKKQFYSYEKRQWFNIFLFAVPAALGLLTTVNVLVLKSIDTSTAYIQLVCLALAAIASLKLNSAPLPQVYVEELMK